MTRPLGAQRNMIVKTSGMNMNIFACTGSAVVGIIFCCQNIVPPMMSGVT